MSDSRNRLLNSRLIISIFLVCVLGVFLMSQFLLVRVQEDSMTPTLVDGQWVVVLRGSRRIHPGDIAVFMSPLDNRLIVKRFIFSSDTKPVIDHGWLVTPWGRWFLTGPQWDRLSKEKDLPGGLFFMVGDNQFQSMDSRSYGYIPEDNMIGRVLLRRQYG